jgi:hypothetical protein
VEAEEPDREPISGIFVGCCASAIAPTVSSSAATKMDDQPAFFIAHLVLEAITHTVIAKRITCGRRQQRFVEGEKANFNAGLN